MAWEAAGGEAAMEGDKWQLVAGWSAGYPENALVGDFGTNPQGIPPLGDAAMFPPGKAPLRPCCSCISPSHRVSDDDERGVSGGVAFENWEPVPAVPAAGMCKGTAVVLSE